MTAILAHHAHGDAQTLIELLSRQKHLYQQLHSLSAQQAGLIEQSQTERLLSVLSQRQMLVDELSELARKISPYRSQIPAIAEAAPAVQRTVLRTLVAEVQELLQGIIEQDDKDRARLAAAKAGVQRDAGRVVRGGVALNAYRSAPGGVSPRFTDHQG